MTDVSAWRDAWRGSVRDDLKALKSTTSTDKSSKLSKLSELEKRRTGLRWMLEDVSAAQPSSPIDGQSAPQGQRVIALASMISFVLFVVMMLLGIGLIRGLIAPFSFYEYDGSSTQSIELRGFNVWILLAVTLGLQWLLIIVSALGYFLWRKWAGSLSFLQNILSAVIGKFGAEGSSSPIAKLTTGDYQHVWKWRLTRIIQASAIGYNAGLIIGLFGCLWFLKVGFYWETSLTQFGEESLKSLTAFLSSPSLHLLPTTEAIDYTNLAATTRDNQGASHQLGSSMSARDAAFSSWSLFFFAAFALWGLLPRIFFWLGAIILEHRACARLSFQQSHHRTLWREITNVQRGEVTSSQSDGAVLLDIGGIELSTEKLRPFLLQQLRINPESRFSLGTLDADGEQKALTAAKSSAMGVVFLVEGWNLSPKQMTIYHQKVRDAIGAGHLIYYVVIGNDEELQQWTRFIDGMKDVETDVHHFSHQQQS